MCVSCKIPAMCWDKHHQKSFPLKNFFFVSIKHEISAVIHFNVSLQIDKQTSSDRHTANYGTIGITCNLQRHAAAYTLSRMRKLTVIHTHVTCRLLCISNNPSVCQQHPGVPVGSDGFGWTSYPLTEKCMLPVAYVPPLLCAQIRTIRTTSVVHSSQRLQLGCSCLHNAWRCLYLFLAECHILRLCYCYILDTAFSPYLFSFEMLSRITIQSSLRIHRLPLHLLCQYRTSHVWNILSNLHTL